jgi:hydroxypyruvate reductase
MRSHARQIFQSALAGASIERAFGKHVNLEGPELHLGEARYDLREFRHVLAISIGKAGHTMAEALAQRMGTVWVGHSCPTGQTGAPDTHRGIIATPVEPAKRLPGFQYFFGGHPTPNEGSIQAAEAILALLRQQDTSSLVLFLLSGGGSSIVERPLADEVSLADLVATYRVLVHSGAPIAEINAIRKHISAVKGGRMAQAAHAAQQVSLLVSDVPDKTPDALASGPAMPDPTTVQDCYGIAAKYRMTEQFPASVRKLFEGRTLQETPKTNDPAFEKAKWVTLLSNQVAVEEAAAVAKAMGFAVEIDNGCDDWDYIAAADYLLGKMRKLRDANPRACLISGGEVTVKVTNGGVGGRNQQFALACATRIAGQNISALSAGTDGIDGNSPAAGAVVDGSTMDRAKAAGLDPAAALARFDAYPLFEAMGDAVITGPTGNNLRDLRVLLAY